MKRSILVGFVMVLAACGAPTAPRMSRPHFDTLPLEPGGGCRSGYQIAYRADGSAYCQAQDE